MDTEQRKRELVVGNSRTFDGGSKTIPNSLAEVTDFGSRFEAKGVWEVLSGCEYVIGPG